MKRSGTTLFAVFLATSVAAPVARAQAATPQFGFTAGLNAATISGGTSASTDSRSNRYDFVGGFTMNYAFNEMFGLQPELLYSRQGMKITSSGAEGTIKISYITVPVLVRFALTDGKDAARPALFIGPYLAMKAGCSASFQAGTISQSGDCASTTVDVPVKSIDFGAAIGGEVMLGSLGVFARYGAGLTSIDDTKPNPDDVKNRVITIGGRWSWATCSPCGWCRGLSSSAAPRSSSSGHPAPHSS